MATTILASHKGLRLLPLALILVLIMCYMLYSSPLLTSGQVSQQLPVRWEDTTHGYTVDCCDGSPDTRYWPQLHLQGRELSRGDSGQLVYEDDNFRKSIFKKIFTERIWGESKVKPNEFSASGGGSSLQATAEVNKTLDCVIEDIKFALNKPRIRMLDVPCGDLVWMSVFLDKRTDVDYTGMDIVPDIIEHHQKVYADRKWTFRVHDIVAEPLSESYDLIFTRDMTMHLTTGDTMKVLEHISTSGSAYGLFSTFPTGEALADLGVGTHGSRRQNLEDAPYSLIPPLCVRPDKEEQFHQYMALWRLPLNQKI